VPLPFAPSQGGISFGALIGRLDLDIDLPGVKNLDPLTARATAQIIAQGLSRELLHRVNVELGRLLNSQYRNTGATPR
jgi:hypothetical protein